MLRLLISAVLVSTTFCHPAVDRSSEDWLQGELRRSKRKTGFFPMLHIQYVHLNESDRFVECKIGGFPSPVVHWEKDGEVLTQSELSHSGIHLPLGMSILKSRLYLGDAASDQAGRYTCVGENSHGVRRKHIDVGAIGGDQGKGPRVKVWTSSTMETQGSYVRLFCRSEGKPIPTVTWFNPYGDRIVHGRKFKLDNSGDLVIKDLAWEDMGTYTCQSENAGGSDAVTAFVYPLAP